MTGVRDIECDYCGLPVRVKSKSDTTFVVSSTDGSPPENTIYCCFGCKVAAAITNERGEEGDTRWQLTRLGIAIFFSMNVTVMTLVLWSWHIYEDQGSSVGQASIAQADILFELLRYTSLLFTTVVVLLLGLPLLENAISQVQQRRITTDLLIAIGVLASFIYSATSVFTGAEHTYFEVTCMVLVAVTLGRWLEAVGRLKTTNTIRALEQLLPASARVVNSLSETQMEESTLPIDEIKVGTTIRVVPGERIPFDGTIASGSASIDEQIVNGESTPSAKNVGDCVFAGTLNHDGDLLIDVTAPAHGGALQRIVDAVTQAVSNRCRWQTSGDYVASLFVPVIAVISVAVFSVHGLNGGFGVGLMAALSVLLIACPCALGIAIPLAVWAAVGKASEVGVLVQNGDAFSKLAATKAICFDKTGTLTTGTPIISAIDYDTTVNEEEVNSIATAIAATSNHVFSTAIRKHLERASKVPPLAPTGEGGRALQRISAAPPHPNLVPEGRRDIEGQQRNESNSTSTFWHSSNCEVLAGRGVAATFDALNAKCYLGSVRLMQEMGLNQTNEISAAIEQAESEAQPIACLGWGGFVRAVFTFKEQFRDEAKSVLKDLQSNGYHVAVLSGDHAGRTATLAEMLDASVQAGLTPDEKLDAIRALREQHGPVAMIGDGINDAPALAEADVGIAMACGADITREFADVCLLGNQLQQVAWAINLAKQTVRTVHQNLFWAFAYNIIGVILAASGYLNPVFAAAAMVGSSLFVITNSLRLANSDASEAISIANDATSPDVVTSTPLVTSTHSAPAVS